MEIKYNEATYNRPKGDRIIDAPFVFIDTNQYAQQLKSEDAWQKNDRNGITVFKTDNYTIVLSRLHASAVIKENTVDGLLTLQVLEGSVDVSVETGNINLKQGQLITIHPGIKHALNALEESLLLIINTSK